MLGKSERLERFWESGSGHSAELADIDSTLEDLVGLLGVGEFRAGTPQRARLSHRITELAAKQEELPNRAVKPAGWTWNPTGETFEAWWARRGVTERNVWLRSLAVRIEFTSRNTSLDLGDIFALTEQMEPSGPSPLAAGSNRDAGQRNRRDRDDR